MKAVLIFLLMLASQPALAVKPDEMLTNPVLEARARALSTELRCLVCQNQSIDDSDASLAKDLRLLVRERLSAGDSDAQVRDFLVARYGEFVLLKPPVNSETYVLWGLPILALLLGFAAARKLFRRRDANVSSGVPLSEEDEQRLATLLEQDAAPKSTLP